MRTLLLLRHAKSSWKEGGLPDFERPLNKRGRKTAPLMGRLLAERELVPDVIVSSTAVRARQTAEAVAEHAEFNQAIHFTDELYPTSPMVCIDVLRSLEGDPASAMLVGHNPGMQELLAHLTGEHEAVQTCVLSRIELDLDDWAEMSVETRGRLVEILRPRELFDV